MAEADSAAEYVQISACILHSLRIPDDSSEEFMPESYTHQCQAIYH